MRQMRFTLLALMVPVLALAMALAGCGGGDTKDKGSKGGDGTTPKGGDGGAKASGSGEKTAIEGKSRGTLKGKVTLDGELPNMATATADLQAKMKAKDEAHCLTGASDA